MCLEDWIRLKLKEHRINCFYYFCHLNNITNVLKHGLLSRNESLKRKLINIDIADKEVVNLRNNRSELFYKRSSRNNYRNICDAVPVYLIHNTPTFYKHRQSGEYKNIVFIFVESFILTNIDEIEFAFTDGNAASSNTNFYFSLKKLEKIPWDVIRSNPQELDLKNNEIIRKRCSEFLIYPSIPVKYFWKFVVYDENKKQKIEKMLFQKNLNKTVEINQSLYYF